ncbi:glycosyltransferase [uncultured Paraglaciecola sp.]|jgi:mannosyltransferase OCH1-like enzyme|uniref:glycosyltransferase family 32 protein n=1 Tax=uncultured Paraglaciecola sp. TaxID=1765024 RepID=UPI0026301DC6|nr:glycosyltransferase [uncultured Paraglaciecola sp.]
MSPSRIFNIPKIIHRTWKDKDIPDSIFKKEWVDSWEKYNPSWEFRFYTDNDINQFMEEFYPEHLEMVNSYDQHIKKIDAFRYFLLYRYGGMYVDLDFECFQPLDSLFIEGANIYLQQNNATIPRVTNAVMISSPGHIFWEHAINRLKDERNLVAGPPVHTGPRFVTRVLGEIRFDDVRILPFGAYFFPRGHEEKGIDIGDDYKTRKNVYGEHKFTKTW